MHVAVLWNAAGHVAQREQNSSECSSLPWLCLQATLADSALYVRQLRQRVTELELWQQRQQQQQASKQQQSSHPDRREEKDQGAAQGTD
jgi:hypothetical protein